MRMRNSERRASNNSPCSTIPDAKVHPGGSLPEHRGRLLCKEEGSGERRRKKCIARTAVREERKVYGKTVTEK